MKKDKKNRTFTLRAPHSLLRRSELIAKLVRVPMAQIVREGMLMRLGMYELELGLGYSTRYAKHIHDSLYRRGSSLIRFALTPDQTLDLDLLSHKMGSTRDEVAKAGALAWIAELKRMNEEGKDLKPFAPTRAERPEDRVVESMPALVTDDDILEAL